jgi:4-amino-4-deoxy-L-arabinose transferase-like glycosyltransferase
MDQQTSHPHNTNKKETPIALLIGKIKENFRAFISFNKLLWQTAWRDEKRAFQLISAMFCIISNFLIGYMYAGTTFFAGWQIIAWMLCILFLFIELFPRKRIPFEPDKTWIVVGVLVIIGFLLRAIASDKLPPGLHTDEYGTVDFTFRHIFPNPNETVNPFRPGLNSHPILYNYILYLFMRLGGYNIFGVRLSSAFAGAMAIAATYFMVRELSNKRVGLIAAIIMTSYQLDIQWSRIALNNIWTTLWLPLAIGFFLWGWRRKWTAGALLSGASLGMAAYFYAGGYIIIILMIFLTIKIWRESKEHIELTIYIGKAIAMALCVAIPLIIYAIFYPTEFSLRANLVYGWTPEAMKVLMNGEVNYYKFFWSQLSQSLAIFNILPETSGFYNSKVPLILGIASPLFLVGIGWTIYKKQYLPVLWVLLVAFFGGMLLYTPPSSSHYVGAIPAICMLIAVPLGWMMDNGRSRWAILLLFMIVATDLIFYFYFYRLSPGPDLILPFPPIPPFTS